MEEIYDLVENVDKEEAYIQKDENSMIIIKPLDAKIGNSTVNIDFSEWKKIIRKLSLGNNLGCCK